MKIPMEAELSLVLLGLGLSVVALALAYRANRRRQELVTSETLVSTSQKSKLEEPNEVILQELKALRSEWAKLSIRFSGQGFNEDDIPAFLLAVANALHRFDRETTLREEGADEGDLLTEAQGYVAILGLALSWAEANKKDGMKMRANELLEHADIILERLKQL